MGATGSVMGHGDDHAAAAAAADQLPQLTADDVGHIVAGMGAEYEPYCDAFHAEGIDGPYLATLDEKSLSDKLRQMGLVDDHIRHLSAHFMRAQSVRDARVLRTPRDAPDSSPFASSPVLGLGLGHSHSPAAFSSFSHPHRDPAQPQSHSLVSALLSREASRRIPLLAHGGASFGSHSQSQMSLRMIALRNQSKRESGVFSQHSLVQGGSMKAGRQAGSKFPLTGGGSHYPLFGGTGDDELSLTALDDAEEDEEVVVYTHTQTQANSHANSQLASPPLGGPTAPFASSSAPAPAPTPTPAPAPAAKGHGFRPQLTIDIDTDAPMSQPHHGPSHGPSQGPAAAPAPATSVLQALKRPPPLKMGLQDDADWIQVTAASGVRPFLRASCLT